jgi:hypothetical protein
VKFFSAKVVEIIKNFALINLGDDETHYELKLLESFHCVPWLMDS